MFDIYYNTMTSQHIRVQYYRHHVSLGNSSQLIPVVVSTASVLWCPLLVVLQPNTAKIRLSTLNKAI